jgi:hypothetical protein
MWFAHRASQIVASVSEVFRKFPIRAERLSERVLVPARPTWKCAEMCRQAPRATGKRTRRESDFKDDAHE